MEIVVVIQIRVICFFVSLLMCVSYVDLSLSSMMAWVRCGGSVSVSLSSTVSS